MKTKMIEKETLYLANNILGEVKPLKLRKQILYKLIDFIDKKITEGAVVLTREENEKWLDFLELNIKKARKEAAREIIQLLDGHQFEDDGWTWSVSKRDLKFIAKKYGVEIEGGNKND